MAAAATWIELEDQRQRQLAGGPPQLHSRRRARLVRARLLLGVTCVAVASLVLTHSVLQAGPFDKASDDTSEGLYWTAGAAWSTCPTTLGFVSSPKTGSTTVAGALAELIGGEAMPNADGSLQLLNGGGEGPFATNIFEHGRAAWADQTVICECKPSDASGLLFGRPRGADVDRRGGARGVGRCAHDHSGPQPLVARGLLLRADDLYLLHPRSSGPLLRRQPRGRHRHPKLSQRPPRESPPLVYPASTLRPCLRPPESTLIAIGFTSDSLLPRWPACLRCCSTPACREATRRPRSSRRKPRHPPEASCRRLTTRRLHRMATARRPG